MIHRMKRRGMAFLLTAAMALSLIPGDFSAVSKAAEAVQNTSSVKQADSSVNLENPEEICKVTETELNEADPNWSKASKFTAYVHITTGSSMSVLNIQAYLGDENELGKTSSKYLVGRKNTLDKTGNTIQDNIVGAAGTGIYQFPEVNLNKSTSAGTALSDDAQNKITITIKRLTSDVEMELLGIRFNNGAVYPKDFTVPKNIESTTPDPESSDPGEVATDKEKLKMTLDYCDQTDTSRYQKDNEAWKAYETALSAAKNVYDTDSGSYGDARTALEKAKSNLLFADSTEKGNPMVFRELSNDAVVKEMGAGINLGNTMDGHSGFTPSETSWQKTITTKKYIKKLHDDGFNTVRIPVTWGTMIDEDNGYALNAKWLQRVQEIVDYCVSQDMYAIINIHHDGAEQTGWLRVSADDIDAVYDEFEHVWRNIATYFKDYDEHLIFESMNEITCMEGDNKNSSAAVDYDTPIIVNLNQIFVNVVRSTGSNNTKRWLAAVAHYANTGTHKSFTLPTDSYNTTNHLMFGAHIYKATTNVTWTYEQVYEMVSGLHSMANKHKVPLYLGEWGNRNYKQEGTESGYNDVARAWYSEIVNKACQKAGCVSIVWDQHYNDNTDIREYTGGYTFYDREECEPVFKTIIDAMMRGTFLGLSEKNENWDFTDIVEDPAITEITAITPSETAVSMNPGQYKTLSVQAAPENTNDVVLWSVDDDAVATVYNGMIHAKAIGNTTVHAYSQSGSAVVDIPVTVTASASENGATAIVTDQDTYEIGIGGSATIQTSLEPADSADVVSYTSSDEEIVTVNAAGKLIGVAQGTAYVIVTAASGVTKAVKVVVKSTMDYTKINLALNVLYNDASHNYYGMEVGQPISVSEDGQYTVEFDLARDLSKAGQKAGITDISNLTAIYIKDWDVSKGNNNASTVKRAKIHYDAMTINDQPVTILEHDFSSAMSNTTFDSGNPVNAWNSAMIEGVTIDSSNHVANFTTPNITKVTVTFTLKELTFKTVTTTDVPATGITDEDITVSLSTKEEAQPLTLSLTPVDTNSKVAFVSADQSIVLVDSKAVTPEGGKVTAMLQPVAEGETTVTALTSSGLSKVIKVIVTDGTGEPGGPSTSPSDAPASPDPGSTDTPAPDGQNSPAPDGGNGQTVPTASQQPAPDAGGDTANGTAAGTEVAVSGATYVVTDAKAKTVDYKAPAKADKTSITVPATVKITENGVSATYKVTGIGKNAFAKCKKLKKVTIGKNIKAIKANAFKNCKKLKTIVLKTTVLKSVGKNAIKGIQKKAMIKSPQKKKKAYKKLFTAKTGYKKSMKLK